MKTDKLSRRWLAAQGCAEDRFFRQMNDVTRITRVIKELMELLQAEGTGTYDYNMVEYEVGVLKKELGSWFIEDYELYIGS